MTGHAYRPGPPTGSAAAHPPSWFYCAPECLDVNGGPCDTDGGGPCADVLVTDGQGAGDG